MLVVLLLPLLFMLSRLRTAADPNTFPPACNPTHGLHPWMLPPVGGGDAEGNAEQYRVGAAAEGRGGQGKETGEGETRALGVPTVKEREAERQLGRQVRMCAVRGSGIFVCLGRVHVFGTPRRTCRCDGSTSGERALALITLSRLVGRVTSFVECAC